MLKKTVLNLRSFFYFDFNLLPIEKFFLTKNNFVVLNIFVSACRVLLAKKTFFLTLSLNNIFCV